MMQRVIGRYSLGLVLGGAVVLGSVVVEAGSIELVESGMVRTNWDGVGDVVTGNDWMTDGIGVNEPRVVEDTGGGLITLNDLYNGGVLISYNPNLNLGGGTLSINDGYGGLGVSSTYNGGNGTINIGGNGMTNDGGHGLIHTYIGGGQYGGGNDSVKPVLRLVGTVDVMAEIVAPVAPVLPSAYVASQGVKHEGSGVRRSLGGENHVTLVDGDPIGLPDHLLEGFAAVSAGHNGSVFQVVNADSGAVIGGSDGFSGIDASFNTGDYIMGKESSRYDLIHASGKSKTYAEMGDVPGWVSEFSSEAVATSRLYGTYEFGHAGEIFASVTLSNKGDNEKLLLKITDADTGEVAYRFDVAEQGVADSQGSWAFNLGGTVEPGRYTFELETSSRSLASMNDGADEGGELGFKFHMGVAFGVDEAYVLYEEEMAVYDRAYDQYRDARSIYYVESGLRRALIEQYALEAGYNRGEFELVGDTLELYEEVLYADDKTGFLYSNSATSFFLEESFFEGILNGSLDVQIEGVTNEMLVTAIEEYFAEEIAGVEAKEVEKAAEREFALQQIIGRIGGLSIQFDALREAYLAEYGVVYATEIASAIPEPTSLVLLGLGAAGLLRRRG